MLQSVLLSSELTIDNLLLQLRVTSDQSMIYIIIEIIEQPPAVFTYV